MRISTKQSYDNVIEHLAERQRGLSDAQVRLTSGKRVLLPSDDPAAAAKAERLLATEMNITANMRAAQASRNNMQQIEGAMADAVELLQQARETVVAAGNGSYSDAERRSLSEKLQSIRDQLLVVANRPDGANGYLFSAQGSAMPPFMDNPPNPALPREQTGVTFYGTPGLNRTEVDTNLPLSADGQAVWLMGRTGNGVFETGAAAGVKGAWIDAGSLSDPNLYYAQPPSTYSVVFTSAGSSPTYDVVRTPLPPAAATPVTVVSGASYASGKGITVDGMTFTISGPPNLGDTFNIQPSKSSLNAFGVLDKIVQDLRQPNMNATEVAQHNAENLRNIDAVMQNIQSARAGAGEVLSRIENETLRLDGLKLSAQSERSTAEDLDMTQAISDFQNKQTGYDAALKSYAMVQRMSLFQYLNG